jgi:hypothetical protein
MKSNFMVSLFYYCEIFKSDLYLIYIDKHIQVILSLFIQDKLIYCVDLFIGERG